MSSTLCSRGHTIGHRGVGCLRCESDADAEREHIARWQPAPPREDAKVIAARRLVLTRMWDGPERG